MGGAFLSLDVARAKALIDKIASNQSWKGDRQPTYAKGVHQTDGVDMLAAKMDLLMKKLESLHQEVNQIMESRITCEICGNTGHAGNDCPSTQRTQISLGLAIPITQATILSKVETPSRTSPTANSKCQTRGYGTVYIT
jgi:hypothetical protein